MQQRNPWAWRSQFLVPEPVENDAAEERQIEEGDKPEHPEGDAGGEASKAGDSDRDAKSRKTKTRKKGK